MAVLLAEFVLNVEKSERAEATKDGGGAHLIPQRVLPLTHGREPRGEDSPVSEVDGLLRLRTLVTDVFLKVKKRLY